MPENTCNAKINQLNTTIPPEHNVAWLHITENNRWLLAMEIFEYITKLPRPAQDTTLRKGSPVVLKQLLKRVSLNVLHYQEMARAFGKKVGECRKVKMIQTR